MSQLTIYIDEQTEQTVRDLAKASGESASKWVADAIRQRAATEWPADALKILGSWSDEDIADAGQLRAGFATDTTREPL